MTKKITIDDAFDYAAEALATMPAEQVTTAPGVMCVVFNAINRTTDIRPLRDELAHSLTYCVHRKAYPWRIIAVGSLEECHQTRQALL